MGGSRKKVWEIFVLCLKRQCFHHSGDHISTGIEILSNTESELNWYGLKHSPVAGSAEHYNKQVELHEWNQRFGSYDGITEDVRERGMWEPRDVYW